MDLYKSNKWISRFKYTFVSWNKTLFQHKSWLLKIKKIKYERSTYGILTGKKVKSMSTFPLSFIIIRLIVESRLSGFLRKSNEFSKAHYHNLFFGLLLLKGSHYSRKFKSLSKTTSYRISSNNCCNNYSFLKMKYWEFLNS